LIVRGLPGSYREAELEQETAQGRGRTGRGLARMQDGPKSTGGPRISCRA
jgi:hypothetical protein